MEKQKRTPIPSTSSFPTGCCTLHFTSRSITGDHSRFQSYSHILRGSASEEEESQYRCPAPESLRRRKSPRTNKAHTPFDILAWKHGTAGQLFVPITVTMDMVRCALVNTWHVVRRTALCGRTCKNTHVHTHTQRVKQAFVLVTQGIPIGQLSPPKRKYYSNIKTPTTTTRTVSNTIALPPSSTVHTINRN